MEKLPNYLNAGLYSGDTNFSGKPWGNDYKLGHIKPDALEYGKYFYAKRHIPGIQNRPGNNTYKNTENNFARNSKVHNLTCYNPTNNYCQIDDDIEYDSKKPYSKYQTNDYYNFMCHNN